MQPCVRNPVGPDGIHGMILSEKNKCFWLLGIVPLRDERDIYAASYCYFYSDCFSAPAAERMGSSRIKSLHCLVSHSRVAKSFQISFFEVDQRWPGFFPARETPWHPTVHVPYAVSG